jgi:hypothetical protein
VVESPLCQWQGGGCTLQGGSSPVFANVGDVIIRKDSCKTVSNHTTKLYFILAKR